ncbi:YceI family protein [Photobacterium halotolerans]|uniref:YceI family protein n=1 Tax=Photobacterium halotolerans TaxID=265726 RepID=A0A7X4WNF5_9GAMM|nr:YceI family protein [Photobacterium halotolerans]NAW65540.1 YceI family protein [Photobacterium halotolerans]NAW85888.1 YceI family protein [Photobacterium halotolerans]NAX45756.1 YceI family protein [Photobacterium halotolerans]
MALSVRNMVFVALAVFPLCASAAWKLDNSQSQLRFLSVKNNSVIEQHTFKELEGSITDQGEVQVMLDLSSVDTQIPIRDERMKAMLFKVSDYPKAMLEGEVDVTGLADLKPGETLTQQVSLKLNLHGAINPVNADLRITRLVDGTLMVSSQSPIIIDGKAFGLEKGITALQEVANLNGILPSVPVFVNLAFVPES